MRRTLGVPQWRARRPRPTSSSTLARSMAALSAVAVLCGLADGQGITHSVTVGPDGSFAPVRVAIRDGDTVEWIFHDATDSIIRADKDGRSFVPAPYDASDPNEFTGPMPFAPSGIFVLGPTDRDAAIKGSTWRNPDVTGVFIRMRWSDIHRKPGTDDESFRFRPLDREIDRAVANGKLYSLSFMAGDAGTPDWIFDTDRKGNAREDGGGVERLTFQQSDKRGGDCGQRVDLGSPLDPTYQQHYFDFLRKVASHLRQRGDRYRALGYVKLSGANVFSHANELPSQCQRACLCNTEVWARSGYTPAKLYDFYEKQAALLAQEFPGKALCYTLVQTGFPLVNDAGEYLTAAGVSSNPSAPDGLPGGTEQTKYVVERGQAGYGPQFVLQHDGLGPTGQVNRFVVRAGKRGHFTGFQTTDRVIQPADLESALQNAWDNSRAVYVEIYEQTLAKAALARARDPEAAGRSIGEWAEELHTRRREAEPDPLPLVHRHTFRRTADEGRQYLYYIHGSKPGTEESPNAGLISILP